MTLKKRYYKKYQGGGGIGTGQLLSLAGTAADTIDPGNQYGRQSTATQTLKGAASGAAIGTTLLPGVGTIAGAVIGGGLGYLGGRKAKQQEDRMKFNQSLAVQQQELNRSNAILSANPALVTGRMGEELYASGGFLKSKYYDAVKATGGNLKPLSTNSAEVQGPSHEQGGVDIPQFESEVEGGETLQDNYVFSDRLGFAKIHRKLARAIGKIEEKPATPERINSLRRMNQQVEDLKAEQEQIRQQYNLA
jgi:hypothetical protein